MTNSNGFYRQTIYYPYNWALQYARGAALDVLPEPGPSYEVPGYGQVPFLDVAGTINPDDGTVSLFILNRDLSKSHQLELNWEAKPANRFLSSFVLTGADLKAVKRFRRTRSRCPASGR